MFNFSTPNNTKKYLQVFEKSMMSKDFIILKINENCFTDILPYCLVSLAIHEGFRTSNYELLLTFAL